MWTTYGTGFITTIGKKEDKKTYYITNSKVGTGAFVIFRVVSRRYINNEEKYESMDCKKYINGSPDNFCKLLIEKRMISISGTLEQYYNPETKITKYTINCFNVDFCGNAETNNIETLKTHED